jgi:GDP-4-dehydro-6-deoxy-D-mannose reductase
MMKALVTGASGFVGGYLVSRLAAGGADVLGLDAVVPPTDGAPGSGDGRGTCFIDGRLLPPPLPGEGVEIRLCDLLDAGAVVQAVSDWGPDVIFHLAAQSSAARSFNDPGGTVQINVMGTLNLLEAVRRGGKARVIVTGSAEEYGRRAAGEMPLTESSPIEPVSPYAASKAAQNILAMQYHRAFGIEVIATRSFSHTGPGQTETFVLPSFSKQCAQIKAGLREPVIRTGNLDVVRDFLDVRDVVEAYLLLAERGTPGATYNVCSGTGLALSDALKRLTEMTGMEIPVEQDPKLFRPADVPVLTGDNGRLASDCGWSAVIGRDKMLSDLFEWWEASVAASGKRQASVAAGQKTKTHRPQGADS